MDKQIWGIAAVLVGGLSEVSCGNRQTGTSGTDAGSAGMAAAGTGVTDSGVSGTGGGGAGGSAGGTGIVKHNVYCAPPGEIFTCVGSSSSGVQLPGLPIAAACCADAPSKTCGSISSTTGMCEAPPAVDTRCPGFMGFASGCCVNNDLCGINASLMGRGCFELGALRMMFGTLLGPGGMAGASGAGAAGEAGGVAGRAGGGEFIRLPNPVHCDGTPVTPPDAGTTATGLDAGS
jgi:hypothetical protein